jgi:YbgC/YbaW family acyl-CoA thioester hydrolase
VRFDEVDLQGVVHHANIVTYLEIARLEFWRHLGISYRGMRHDGYEFIVRKVDVRYKKPLLFDDMITADVSVSSLARASFVLAYDLKKPDGTTAVVAEIELVCAMVGRSRPTALPQKFRMALQKAFDAA